jgi:hypothetical protein
LELDRTTLLARLSLEGLVERPEAWEGLRDQFNQFRRRYQNEYQKHHRDHYEALARLGDGLADLPRRIEALGLLNRIEALGAPLGNDLASRYEALQGQLELCPLTRVTDVNVEHNPTCAHCPHPLRLTDEPPEEEAQALRRDLNNALDSKRRQLASEAISRILAGTDRADMKTFLDALRASDLVPLVDAMTPQLAAFIDRLLAEKAVLTTETDVLRQLAQHFPTLEESEVDAALAELRRLLQAAFAQARRDNPDKRTVRLNLR